MSELPCLRLSTCSLALVIAAQIAPVSAQTSDLSAAQPEEKFILAPVIVTARRVTENLQEVPLAVQAIKESEIVRANVRGMEDVARLSAGLTYDIGGFPNDTRPAVRGMQSERGRPSVAVMLDGVDLSGENLAIAGGTAGVATSLLDIERIEVVKGPQSTLYGRNAFAGAINYISKVPDFERELNASLELADAGTMWVGARFPETVLSAIFREKENRKWTTGTVRHWCRAWRRLRPRRRALITLTTAGPEPVGRSAFRQNENLAWCRDCSGGKAWRWSPGKRMCQFTG
jgi:hypothetical protein